MTFQESGREYRPVRGDSTTSNLIPNLERLGIFLYFAAGFEVKIPAKSDDKQGEIPDFQIGV
ncbi:MAG: hypothetical protein J5736_03015, partial [Bacilli bacterium]|nr:hypothetical protein [Bacilli bacterium]